MRKFILALALLSACYLHNYPVTYDVAESGTYKLMTENSGGTAWAVDHHHMITAGHMCERANNAYYVTSSTGRRWHVKAVQWEMGDDGRTDLCLLESETYLDNPLVISERMPKIGEKVAFVGYPNLVYTQSEGKYLGDVDGPDETYGDYTISAMCDHGASGSASFISEGVFGVVVRLRVDGGEVRGTDGCTVIPLFTLVDFLKDTGVDYVTTPHLPTSLDG
jgi:hypothetical protein